MTQAYHTPHKTILTNEAVAFKSQTQIKTSFASWSLAKAVISAMNRKADRVQTLVPLNDENISRHLA